MFETIKLRHNSPEWLAFRKTGVGASEAAAILGYHNNISNVDLWEIKTGRKKPVDISDAERVKYGIAAEKYLVGLFALHYAGIYKVKVNKTVVYRKDGFQFASLDGELTDCRSKQLGVYEGKTVFVDSGQVWDRWRDRIPQNYYIQILHQLLVTGREFVIIQPEFRWTDNDGDIETQVKRFRIDRSDVLADMKMLDEAEHEFWGYVKRNECPPRVLPQI